MRAGLQAAALVRPERHDWPTPSHIFDPLHAEFGFTLDVCASPDSAKVPRYFTEADEGLLRSWEGERCWMNPPYGRQLTRWMEKAWTEAGHALIVCLIPSRTDTAWWHDYVMKGEIRFLRGRITFEGAPAPAPFPSCVVIF